MTTTLLISTSTTIQIAALQIGDEVRQRVRSWRRGRPRTLLADLRELLAGAGFALTDLDRIACDVGPGSFTGLRYGLATARALAFCAGVGTVGPGSLEAMLAAAPPDRPGDLSLAALPSRRGVVYVRLTGPKPVQQELPIAEFEARLQALPGRVGTVVAPAGLLAELPSLRGASRVDRAGPTATALLDLAAGLGTAGWSELLPCYLAPSQAERNSVSDLLSKKSSTFGSPPATQTPHPGDPVSAVYELHPRLAIRAVAGEAFLVTDDRAFHHARVPTAVTLLQALQEGPRSAQELSSLLVSRYKVDARTATADVARFMQTLVDRLVVVRREVQR